MQFFYLTLEQMLSIFIMIMVGFTIRKKCNFPDHADSIIANLETCVFVPALFLHTQMTQCTVASFRENYTLMLYGLGVVAVAIAVAYPLARLFVPKREHTAAEDYQRGIYRYALTFGNYGYLGMFIVQEIWGAEMLSKYMLFTALIGIVCNSWGLYILVPKEKNASLLQNLKTGLLKPPLIALVIGTLLGILNAPEFLPEFVLTAAESAGKCQGPIAMVLAGFIIGGYDFKKLITNKKVYVVSLLRLIAIPAAMMLVMRLLGISKEIMTLTLMAFAAPLGMNTIVYPAAYGGDTQTGASMTSISHILAIATLPLMYLLFIVLW